MSQGSKAAGQRGWKAQPRAWPLGGAGRQASRQERRGGEVTYEGKRRPGIWCKVARRGEEFCG